MQPLAHIHKFEQKLGIGAHGIVYLGFDDEQGRFVAIKEIPYCGGDGSNGANTANQILQEMRVLQRSGQHEHLVNFYGARRCTVGVQLIMEYMGGGSVERLLKLRGRLPEAVVRRYTKDILRGLQCLHDELKVCHRDVKPANVLLTPAGQCKLTDFGVSKILVTATPQKEPVAAPGVPGSDRHAAGEEVDADFTEDPFMQTTVGTPWYMAPEVISGGEGDEGNSGSEPDNADGAESSLYYNPLRGIAFRGEQGSSNPGAHRTGGNGSGDDCVYVSQYERKMRAQGYTTSADIWSLGVTVYEMISGQKPFGTSLANPTAVLFCIINSAAQPPTLPEEVRRSASHELRNFLDLCFVYDKALRPSASELLAHPWMAATGCGDNQKEAAAKNGVAQSEGGRSRCGSLQPHQPQQQHRQTAAAQPPQGRGSASSHRDRHSAVLKMACTPMLDIADLPPQQHLTAAATVLAPLPARRRSNSSRTPRGQSSQRRSSSPHTSSGSSGNTPSPLYPRRGTSTVASPLGPRSMPPELPAIPEGANGRGGDGTGTTPVPIASRHTTTSEGFFSRDGHYVDLIARLPSSRR